MMELTVLGLILGFIYVYLEHEDKIKAHKFFCWLFRLLGSLLVLLAITMLAINIVDCLP